MAIYGTHGRTTYQKALGVASMCVEPKGELMHEEISLMMVTYNRLELTKQTIDSLSHISTKHNLIVVDNGSTDHTVDYFKNKFTKYNSLNQFKFICNNKNKGIAIGRNQTLKAAVNLNTKWFCTIDNDVLVPSNFISECISIINTNPGYCIGVNFEGKEYPIVYKRNKKFQEKPQGNLGTACAMFSDRLQKMIGFFNTSFGLYSHEDADYFFRARMAGFKMGYICENGTHIGEGENDMGKYREFKTKSFNDNLSKYHHDSHMYAQRKKPIYLPYKD